MTAILSAFRKCAVSAILMSFLVLQAPTAATADLDLPDTPAGRVLAAWLQAFNSGDQERIDNFYKQHLPKFLADDPRSPGFRAGTGGFDAIEVRKTGPFRAEIVVKEKASPTTAFIAVEVHDGASGQADTFFMSPIPRDAEILGFDINADTRARVIEGAISALNESYVSPEIAKEMETDLRTRLEHGEFNAMSDGATFAAALTDAMRAVSHDKHLRLGFSPAKLKPPAPPSAEAVAQMRAQMQKSNCRFQPGQRLPGNIGLLKFNAFPPLDACSAAASAMMNSVEDVDALIVDLRDNGGGSPAMVAYLSTYLFDKRTHVTDVWTRKTDNTEEFWTQPDAPGKRLAKQPVFILTSARTFSGAEDFSYSLQALKRATIVGETTGGGAHPVSGRPIDDRFTIGVPFAKTVNPITKTNWEGTGVEPDVKVPAAEALETARKLAQDALAKR